MERYIHSYSSTHGFPLLIHDFVEKLSTIHNRASKTATVAPIASAITIQIYIFANLQINSISRKRNYVDLLYDEYDLRLYNTLLNSNRLIGCSRSRDIE